MKELITERLYLRYLKEDDYNAMYENWSCDIEVTKYVTWEAHKDISTTKLFLNSKLEEYKNPNSYIWGIELIDTKELIGQIDVVNIINNSTPEIGYVLSKKYWNKGIMTEACKAVIDYLLNVENFTSIIICADTRNIGSNNVIKKVGGKFKHSEPFEFKNKHEKVMINIYQVDKNV